MMPQRHRHRHRRTCSEMYGLVRDESECYPARNQSTTAEGQQQHRTDNSENNAQLAISG
jgi:hypothetical protein